MPTNWPELSLALALALVAAYVVTSFLGRRIEAFLRALVPDEREHLLVDSPMPVIRGLLFLLTAFVVGIPGVRLAGFRRFNRNPEAFAEWLLGAGVQILFIAVAAYIIIRIGRTATRQLEHEMSAGTGLDVIERTKRARTIGTLLQNFLVAVVVGIAGLAVGFGAQTLVRDVISGFFLIVEDQVRVGDVAVVNGTGGLVEAVNLRTIVLRDEEGAVHVFPNGEVKTLANKSKDFAYYVLSVGVPWDEDPDRVADAMQIAADSLLNDPEFRIHILEPLEVYGIDTWEPTQLVLKGRIKTVPLKQWTVGRELRKRIAKTFRERGIRTPGLPVIQVAHPAPPKPQS